MRSLDVKSADRSGGRYESSREQSFHEEVLASKCKSPELLLGLYLGPGNVLLSHGRTTLSSAMTRFTFLFEMGRSGTKSLLSPSYSCALALGFFLRLRCFTPHLLSCKLRRARLILLRIFFSYFGLFSLTRRLELDIHIVFFDLRYYSSQAHLFSKLLK